MEKTKTTVLLFSYFKRHVISFILICLFVIIFAIVFSLYNLPLEAIGYASVLCIAIGGLTSIIDFIKYCRKHKLLSELYEHIGYNIDEIPIPTELIELDYYHIIKKLHTDKIRIISENDYAKTEIMDYYTLWVHQIKTPIAAMRLLLQSEETAENEELLIELFRIEQYVEMVLQYLRLDSMSSDLVLKKYELSDIIKQAIRKHAKVFIRKKIALNFTEQPCSVLTDEKWLLFVIEQILSNSLKYTKRGNITIRIEADSSDESSSNSIVLVIEDTGIGIAAEDLPRVIEKGFTGYNGRSDKKSTGIGLYLSNRILRKLSHKMEIESEVDKGTTVRIYLDTLDLIVE